MSARAQNLLIDALRYCRDAEVVEEQRTEIDLANPHKHNTQKGLGIRVNSKGRLGYAWAETWKSEKELLRQALADAESGPEGSFSLKGASPVIAAVPPCSVEHSLKQMQAFIKGLDFMLPSLLPERSFHLQARLLRHSIAITTNTGERQATRSLHFVTLHSSETPRVSAALFTSAPAVNPADMLCTLAWRTVHSREVAWPDEYQLPAVFTAEASGKLLQDFASDCLCVDSGAAPGFNKPWLNSLLNIADDGTIPGAFGTTPFDGEGLPRKRVELVNQGRLVGQLGDKARAKAQGQTPLGLAVRRWGHPPEPGYSNLVLGSGQSSLGELCAEIDYGILLDRLSPVALPAAPGEFCRRIETGFLVQDGLPVCRAPALVVRGRYEDIFGADLIELGVERSWHGRTETVPLACRNLQFSDTEVEAGSPASDIPGLWW